MAEEITTASGLKYTDVVEGTGASPTKGKLVTVHYTGTFEDGKNLTAPSIETNRSSLLSEQVRLSQAGMKE